MQPDAHGPRDAGGIEMAPHDELVVSGGFVGDLRTWRLNKDGGSSVSRIAEGREDAGALLARMASLSSPAAASYCVAVPAPGDYLLRGSALVSESDLLGDWVDIQYHFVATRGCNEAPLAVGLMPFAAEIGWMQRERIVTVPPGVAALKLALVVRDSGHVPGRFALFDNISLRRLADETPVPGRVFADGFD